MKKTLLLFLICFCANSIYAQIKVEGEITSATDGLTIPGVNVFIKGTNAGTITDLNGKYNIEVPDESTILVFSYIGFEKQEITVGKQRTIDIVLTEDTESLEEVVVVGYGVQKARDVTGAISKVGSEKLSLQPVTTFDIALQGLATGVQVTQASGTPGGAVRIMIRGTNSISSGTEPLYIVDGIPIWQDISGNLRNQSSADGQAHTQNPLADINPNDIESIEVLKDAAATSIYGSRGANGVIIITTKSGKVGQGRVSVNIQKGITTPANLLEYANTAEWFEMVDQSRININMPGGDHVYTPNTYKFKTEWSRLRAEHTDINHLANFIGNGSIEEYAITSSNASEKGTYFISLNYKNEKGIATGNVFKRYNVRANTDFTPVSWLSVGTRIGLSYIDNNRPIMGASQTNNMSGQQNKGSLGGFWAANKTALPMFPVYDDDGEYFDPRSGANVTASSDRDHVRDNVMQYRAIGQFFTEIKPLKCLRIRGEASIDYLNTNQIIWISGLLRTIEDKPSKMAYDLSKTNRNMNYVAYANYNKVFNQKHDIGLTVGTELNRLYIRRRDNEFENLTNRDQEVGEFPDALTDNALRLLGGVFEDKRFASIFSRANYKLLDKYIVGFSLRRDGSTVFGEENRWGTFAAGSAGWIISAEPFMQAIPVISFLKIRGSYGVAGNANIRSGLDQEGYQTWASYGSAGGMALENLANTELTWEKSHQTDVSLEFGILQNRISGSLGYYNMKTVDMLLDTPIPYSVGLAMGSSAWINVGNMRNKGFEFECTSINIHKGSFKWTTTLNFSTNRNEILDLTPALDTPKGIVQSNVTSSHVGGRLGAFYLAEYAGLDDEGYETIYELNIEEFLINESGEFVDESGQLIPEGTSPVRNPEYLTKTGNIIRATQTNVDEHKIIHEDKTGIPTYFGGLSNTFSFKGFELSVFLNWQGGNYIYDKAEQSLSYVDNGTHNILARVYNNTWTPENTAAEYPMLRWLNNQSPETDNGGGSMGKATSKYLYKADYLRLRSVNIAYNIPKKICKRLRSKGIRIYFTAYNLATFTGYEGYDPEFVVLGSYEDRNLTQGYLQAYNLPLIRSFVGGINIDF